MDDQMRQALVREAVKITEQGPPPAGGPDDQRMQQYYRTLGEAGVLHLPTVGQWTKNWANVNPAGLIVSILLLSLGAPFWFNALSSLVRLRSVLAQKGDAERSGRESSQALAAVPARPATASPTQKAGGLAGESGNLVAVG